jgi:hypothetical protein
MRPQLLRVQLEVLPRGWLPWLEWTEYKLHTTDRLQTVSTANIHDALNCHALSPACSPYCSVCLHTRVSASPGPQTQTAISTSASLDCIVTDWRCHNKPWSLIHAPVQTISASSHLLFVPSLDIDSSTAEQFCLGDGIDDPRQAGVPDTRVKPAFPTTNLDFQPYFVPCIEFNIR